MKKIIVLFNCMLCLSYVLLAQISAPKSSTITKKNDPVKIQTLQVKPVNTVKDMSEKLPDLRFTAFNVTATAYIDNGVTKYRLNISYTVKNDGNASVLTDDVTIQSFLTTESGLTKDLSFTSYFTPAGGNVLSDVTGKGETLAPGATKQLSFSPGNFQLQRDPKPVYLITINAFGGVKESNTTNNRASMTILFN